MRWLYLYLIVIMHSQCGKIDYDVACLDQSIFESKGDFSKIHIGIPNIIINDDPDYGAFGLSISEIDSLVGIPITPNQLEVEIFNNEDELIYSSNTITNTNLGNYTYLWDGLIDGVAYHGKADYHIQIGFEDGKSATLIGENIYVISCQDLQNCYDGIGDCLLDDCRYFSQFIDTGFFPGPSHCR